VEKQGRILLLFSPRRRFGPAVAGSRGLALRGGISDENSTRTFKSGSQLVDYKVKLEVFEGPLDLLLYLIKRDEVDIYDISIERIAKQYLEYMEAFQVLNIGIAGEFIVMAANLLYIKSRTLLPKDQQMAEEDADEDDPRWELIRQLIEYKKFKEAASHLRTREAMQEKLFPRFPAMPEFVPSGNLLIEEVGIFDLINAFQKILKRLESRKSREDLREIFEENFTVSDKIDFLLRVIHGGVPLRFEECFADAAGRAEIVVTFLAMLELIRLKQLRVRQDNDFEEIWIERSALAAPASIERLV
jgi:segregation and condensation protein A